MHVWCGHSSVSRVVCAGVPIRLSNGFLLWASVPRFGPCNANGTGVRRGGGFKCVENAAARRRDVGVCELCARDFFSIAGAAAPMLHLQLPHRQLRVWFASLRQLSARGGFVPRGDLVFR